MLRKQPQLQPREESILAAAEFSAGLRAGCRPNPIPAAIQLFENEQVYADAPVQVVQFAEAEVTYQQQNNIYFGESASEMIGFAVGQHLVNRSQQRKAEAMAAAQWRVVDEGNVYLTNGRFACALRQQWVDLWYQELRASQCDGDGVILWYEGMPPTKLRFAHPEWMWVMFRHLAYGEAAWVEVPPELAEKAAKAGRGASGQASAAPQLGAGN